MLDENKLFIGICVVFFAIVLLAVVGGGNNARHKADEQQKQRLQKQEHGLHTCDTLGGVKAFAPSGDMVYLACNDGSFHAFDRYEY